MKGKYNLESANDWYFVGQRFVYIAINLNADGGSRELQSADIESELATVRLAKNKNDFCCPYMYCAESINLTRIQN